MRLLLVIGFLIPFVYLGFLMSKLDKFLEKNAMVIDDNKIYLSAIVLGKTDFAKQITELLEKDGVKVLLLTEPFLFKQEWNFCYLFALSENDADNIVLSKIGRKVYNMDRMISICNDRRNEGLFANEKIHYLLGEKATAQMLYHAVLQETEVKL